MERVQDAENTIEVFKNDIDYYLREFVEINNVEDIDTMHPNKWNACLIYIQEHVFPKGNNKLKLKDNIYINNNNIPSTFNSYDYDLVCEVCQHYVYISFLHCKEITLSGFARMTGINLDTLYSWSNGEVKLNKTSSEVIKKLSQGDEDSLIGLLLSGKVNPVSPLSILNKRFGYNMAGVPQQGNGQNQITASQLPILKAPSDDTNTIDVNAIDTTDPTQ
jgi:hypothetical protein